MKNFIKQYGYLLLMFLTYSVCEPNLEVKTKNGIVRGRILKDPRTDKEFYAFSAIPFAKPPVGELRFKAPKPVENWSGVRDATKEGPVCPQISVMSGKFEGNEDCLHLNVYTPELKENCSIPVMVWIHGGSFSFGSGNIDYSGFHYLVGENVVVVTINFRLNILGFLNLRNEKVPGNAGFKDQVQALKWVKENIAYFGGDPNKVTLAGESSGGALVQYHILSPMSKGLFHQAISESGSCLAPYAFKERTDNIAFSVGEKLGYSTKDKDELLKHLMNSSPEQLVTTTNEFYNMGKGAKIEVPFTPTADRDSPAGDICIPDNPANLVKSGQYKSVPYITGFNSAEGILLVNGIKNTAVKNIEGTLESFSCEDFGIEEDNCNRKEIARKINEHYFTNSSDLKMKAESFINFTTDIYFLNQAYCSIRKMTPHFKAPIYMYEFSFTGNNLMYKKLFNGEEFPGAAHVEELAYMQYNTYKYQPNSRELLTSKRLNRLWGNFIKTGNPTPVPEPLLEEVIWPPVGKRDLVYLNINNDLSVQRNPKKKSLEFWSQIHKNYSNNTVC